MTRSTGPPDSRVGPATGGFAAGEVFALYSFEQPERTFRRRSRRNLEAGKALTFKF